MNERFVELKRRAVAEADTSHIDFDNMSHTEIQMLGDIATEKKFAELIVRECCDWIGGSPSTDSGQLLLTKSFIIANLKGHFGVKE
jgi:hypothetical protein